MSKIVTSLFPNSAEAGRAVDQLVAAGFGTADISVLMAQGTGAGQEPGNALGGPTATPGHSPGTVTHGGTGVTDRPRSISLEDPTNPYRTIEDSTHRDSHRAGDHDRHGHDDHHRHAGGPNFAVNEASKAPEGATAGATVGGALGGILMGLVATGIILIPGVNVVAAGPLLAVLAGIGGGGTVGGLLGGLVGMGIPEHEAKLVEQGLERGSVLVGVRAHADRVDVARKLLQDAGGTHVH